MQRPRYPAQTGALRLGTSWARTAESFWGVRHCPCNSAVLPRGRSSGALAASPCPVHRSQSLRSKSFSVHLARDVCHCFRCGFAGKTYGSSGTEVSSKKEGGHKLDCLSPRIRSTRRCIRPGKRPWTGLTPTEYGTRMRYPGRRAFPPDEERVVCSAGQLLARGGAAYGAVEMPAYGANSHRFASRTARDRRLMSAGSPLRKSPVGWELWTQVQ